jgi:hypothetical protein
MPESESGSLEARGYVPSADDPAVVISGVSVPIERSVFETLFHNSVVSSYAGVRKALEGTALPYAEFMKLARQAEIPYPLFFASLPVVEAQVRLKTEKLMAGFTKDFFSMHSRHRVELRDVELIVKDLLRKQAILSRYDRSLGDNAIVGMLKKYRGTVPQAAKRLADALEIDVRAIRGAKNREAAFDALVARFEARQIFVARSAQHFMPQELPSHAKFSGMTIKDKKVPFVFLATGDEGEHLEPAGRRIFTLVLMGVLIARDTFAPVNYDGHTKDEASPLEYQLTAEILMPAADFGSLRLQNLDDVKEAADQFMLTPSAVAMRARRLGKLGRDRFGLMMDALKVEYDNRERKRLSSPLPVNAIRKYNGAECSRRMLALLDSGDLSVAQFRRVVCFNKISTRDIPEFRRAVS